ncbi:MAG: hypothetical protein IT495_10015 [Gammaproteobacteria bacterium]|nr:hypothetical protein [Gammaproteobacteria bacterium]
MHEPAQPPLTVTRAQLCAVCGVSPSTILRWRRAGMPHAGPGRFDLAACVRWVCAHLAEHSAPTAATERRQLLRAKTDRETAGTAHLRATLLSAETAARVIGELVALIDAELRTAPDRLATACLLDDDARAAAVVVFAREIGSICVSVRAVTESLPWGRP